MNQILDYNPNSSSGNNNGGGSDKIVRVFAIILIIFAIAVIGVIGYGKISNKQKIESEAEEVTYANIEVETEGDGATIKVNHDKNIKKIIYSWNTSSERTITGTGEYMEETIDVPAGDNTLHIKVIDENGVETTHDEEVSAEEGVDIVNPIIDLAVTDDKKLKITITDETGLDFMTYRWNDEEEETIYADEGSKEDGSSIDIKAVHENGIESVTYQFNNVNYSVDIGDGHPTEIQFPQKLEIGYNRIVLTVKSVDGTETTFDGECTYGNEQSSNNSSNENEETQENNNSEQE